MSRELAEKIVDLFAENRYDSPLITQISEMIPEVEALLRTNGIESVAAIENTPSEEQADKS